MSATLLQLRDQLKIDAGIAGVREFPDLRLNRIINLAQRFVQVKLNGLGFKKWETSQLITAGLSAYAWGSASNNCKKVAIGTTYFPDLLETPKSIKMIEVNTSDQDEGGYGIAKEVDSDNFHDLLQNTYLTPTVKKAVFMRLSGYVYLAPLSITAATAHYYKAISDLSSDSDKTAIPVEFEEYILKRAVMEVDIILKKITDAAAASAEIETQLKDAYKSFLTKEAEDDRLESVLQ